MEGCEFEPGAKVKRFLSALLCALLLAAQGAHAQPAGGPASIDAEVAALRTAAGSHRLVVLGEMHGTREAPDFAGRLAAAYAREAPLVLALEIDASEQAAIGRYLVSAGTAADRATLLAGEFWNVSRAHNDGRRSGGVLALIEAIRRLRGEGRDVSVLAVDAGAHAADSQARDAAMARVLRACFSKLPRGRLLVLAGNVHAMRRRPDFAPPEMQTPMASRLADLDLYSVNLTAAAGRFWNFGPRDLVSRPMGSGALVDDAWDYEVVLPQFTIADLVVEGRLLP
jgi:erythromycin esterase-like protein